MDKGGRRLFRSGARAGAASGRAADMFRSLVWKGGSAPWSRRANESAPHARPTPLGLIWSGWSRRRLTHYAPRRQNQIWRKHAVAAKLGSGPFAQLGGTLQIGDQHRVAGPRDGLERGNDRNADEFCQRRPIVDDRDDGHTRVESADHGDFCDVGNSGERRTRKAALARRSKKS